MRSWLCLAALLAACSGAGSSQEPSRLSQLAEPSGQVDESTAAPKRPTTPPKIPGPTARSTLSSGSFHTCMIDEGDVWCWGHGINMSRVFGNRRPRISNSKVPRLMKSATGAIEVASGKFFTCALLSTGRVRCWGDNRHNQLGGNGLVGRATQITAGERHACALLSDSSVECWGRYSTSKGTVQLVKSGAKQISAGAMHTCVLMNDGTIQCIGKYATPYLTGTPRTDFAGVASGSYHACGWTAEGKVYCWGKTDFGALGAKLPKKDIREPILVPGISDARRVSAGAAYACAVLATGKVQCWGHDGYGQQGVRKSNSVNRIPVTGLERTVEVAAGGRHVCARTDRSEVFCWGDNNWGELGNGTTGQSWLPQRARFPSEATHPIARSKSQKRRIRRGSGLGQRVLYDLDSAAELKRDGWTRRAAGTSVFRNGIMTIHANGGEGWRLERRRAAASPWWRNAGSSEGWAVEARVRIDPASPPVSKVCPSGGPGLYVHDGLQALRLLITPTSARLGTVKGKAFPVAATRGYHTYRLERRRDRFRILIDGRVVHTHIGPPAPAASRDYYVKFGDLGCSRATSYWDYFAYETALAKPVAADQGDWHRGVRITALLAALDDSLPVKLRGRLKALRLPQEAARCVAVVAMDYAARDLLPKSWTAMGRPGNRNLFTSSKPLSDPKARTFLAKAMARFITPRRCVVSDRRCRQNPPRAPKTPAGYHSLLRGLELSTKWALHPMKVYESMKQVGSVYGAAMSSVPGAEASASEMIRKIASLSSNISSSCNLP